jgi:anti-sigma factor RsiW
MTIPDPKTRLDALLSLYEDEILSAPDEDLAAPAEIAASAARVRSAISDLLSPAPHARLAPAPEPRPRRKRTSLRALPPSAAPSHRARSAEGLRATFSAVPPFDETDNDEDDSTK